MSGEERQSDIELARAMGLMPAESPEQGRERREQLIEEYETQGKFEHPVFRRYNRLMAPDASKVDTWADRVITDLNREVGAMLVLLQLRREGNNRAALDYVESRTDISDEVLEREMQGILAGFAERRAEVAHKPLDKGEN